MSSGGTLYLFYLLPCWVKYQQYCLRSAALAWGPFFDELLFISVVMCTKEVNSFCKNTHATSTGTSLWLGKFWVQLLNQCAKWQYRQTSTWKQYVYEADDTISLFQFQRNIFYVPHCVNNEKKLIGVN
jgi:hypothetical protein